MSSPVLLKLIGKNFFQPFCWKEVDCAIFTLSSKVILQNVMGVCLCDSQCILCSYAPNFVNLHYLCDSTSSHKLLLEFLSG